MPIIQNNTQINNALENMLQGLAFWMGYSRCMNEVYEHDCVHQAFAILRANLGKDKYALEYEYNYSDLDKTITTQERADLVILKKTPKRKTPICVMEFKMSDNTNGGVEADVIKLRKINKPGLLKFVILLFYSYSGKEKKYAEHFMNMNGNVITAKRIAKLSNTTARVRCVKKAMTTANKPKRYPFMAVCIEA